MFTGLKFDSKVMNNINICPKIFPPPPVICLLYGHIGSVRRMHCSYASLARTPHCCIEREEEQRYSNIFYCPGSYISACILLPPFLPCTIFSLSKKMMGKEASDATDDGAMPPQKGRHRSNKNGEKTVTQCLGPYCGCL